MMMTTTANDLFQKQGLVVIPEVISREQAADWARRAIIDSHRAHRIDREDETGADGRTMRHHFVLDALQVQAIIPELWDFYQKLPAFVAPIVGREVILSPYERSAVNVKVYAPGDDHGWHYDTNALTALLYLTETDSETGTLVELDGETFPLIAKPGDLLVMNGREINHKVRAVPEHAPTRVTVPLNLYYPDDIGRPEDTDELVYGSA